MDAPRDFNTTGMHITKRRLGTNYVVGTGLVLGGLLLAQLLLAIPDTVPVWALVGLVPAVILATGTYWLRRVEFTGDQIWVVAQASALGLALVLFAGTIIVRTQSVVVGPTVTLALASMTTLGAMVGALAGVAWEFYRTNRRLTVRNDVLNRVIRHNLRNDMTVVQGHLDHVKQEVGREHRDEIDTVQRKVDALLGLTEKIRQIDITIARGERTRQPVDVVEVIDARLNTIKQAYPQITFEYDTPPEALAYADDLFGTVLDNVIESAVVHGTRAPTIDIEVTETSEWVEIRILDETSSLPENDLAIVDGGFETQLDHSQGIEFWLVDWLVEGYGGEVGFEATPAGNAIEIKLRQATPESSLFG